jgi:hypothetical protein
MCPPLASKKRKLTCNLEEVLMRRTQGQRRSAQLGLFRLPTVNGSWVTLPPETQEKARRLIALLLRQQRERKRQPTKNGEAGHD